MFLFFSSRFRTATARGAFDVAPGRELQKFSVQSVREPLKTKNPLQNFFAPSARRGLVRAPIGLAHCSDTMLLKWRIWL